MMIAETVSTNQSRQSMSDEVVYTSMHSIIQQHRNINSGGSNMVHGSGSSKLIVADAFQGSYRPSSVVANNKSSSEKQSETNPNVTFRRPSELAAGILY